MVWGGRPYLTALFPTLGALVVSTPRFRFLQFQAFNRIAKIDVTVEATVQGVLFFGGLLAWRDSKRNSKK